MKNKTKNKNTQYVVNQFVVLFLIVSWLKINTI